MFNRYGNSGSGFEEHEEISQSDYDVEGNLKQERKRILSSSPNQRIAVLVDVQNMFYAARELHGGKINYKKLLDFTVRGRHLTRAIAYCVTSPDKDATNFLRYLEAVGFEIRSKELKKRSDGTTRGSWEVGLTIDAVTLSSRVDTLCLITGDGDYALLANALRNMGVRVEGYGFKEFTSQDLINNTHRFYSFDERIIGEYIEESSEELGEHPSDSSTPGYSEHADEVPETFSEEHHNL